MGSLPLIKDQSCHCWVFGRETFDEGQSLVPQVGLATYPKHKEKPYTPLGVMNPRELCVFFFWGSGEGRDKIC